MSTTEQRLAANRANAMLSTGPVTETGKAVASRNSTRHGLLSTRLLLDDEDPAQFDALFGDLFHSLSPVGTIELALVERIAITLWRQRRLVQAETAHLAISRQPRCIAATVSKHIGRGYGSALRPEELLNFDEEREKWCRGVLAELGQLEDLDIATLERQAPLIFQQLSSDAAEDKDPIAKFLGDHKGGLSGYIAELIAWCHEQIGKAESRPQIQALAEQVRAKRLILNDDALELIGRYQSCLDNHLYKGLRALRDAQEWRLKMLDGSATGDRHADEAVCEAA